ncbi:MAG TPA: hypothetical protein VEJ18_16135, partial [Planctomycetota bacterium]|nr:hypothetical protein [Planctomycetota bacterium]
GPVLPEIEVVEGGWGAANPADIRAVCRSAAEVLLRHVPGRRLDPISLTHSPDKGPMVIYGRGGKGERRVLLSPKDTYWARFAYQFAHELAHILCGYRDGDPSNQWFEESVCEAASLFALRRMAEAWKTRPPYANWKGYADELARYADERIASVPPRRESLARWYRGHELLLREKADDRPKNQVVAVALLELLEKDPSGWRAFGALNDRKTAAVRSFGAYLRDWHDAAAEADRPFVRAVAALFEIEVAGSR